ncbi:MAG: PASTA domain-containing protein [Actinobacteria bacterium]|nr:PASTA domain-containing protein [Actinomycetota bacterium]
MPYGDARAGRVIAQSIPAGTSVPSGIPLQLTVAVALPAPTTTTTPQATTSSVP